VARLWFDTEFIDDGRTVSLLSIGVVRDDGSVYYAEPAEADRSAANPWVRAHVLPLLTGPVLPRAEIAKQVREFAGSSPEWWASFGAYDWVLLCQLYGPLEDHPPGWPWGWWGVAETRRGRNTALPRRAAVRRTRGHRPDPAAAALQPAQRPGRRALDARRVAGVPRPRSLRGARTGAGQLLTWRQ
jgi:hypothetical protein